MKKSFCISEGYGGGHHKQREEVREMRYIQNVIVFIVLFFFFPTGPIIVGTSCASEWQQSLEQKFDVVETFDDIDDWLVHSGTGDVYIELNPGDFPTKNNGTAPSMWCYYSRWSDTLSPAGQLWIGDFGAGTRWGSGGKSAVIDLSNTEGPSRIGVYFGDGSDDSGYSEIYVFYMTKISASQWPTQCVKDGADVGCMSAGGTGVYEAGKNYSYWSGWKFSDIGTGWNSCQKWNGGVPSFNDRYGDSSVLVGILLYNYGPIPRVDGKPGQKQNIVLNLSVDGPSQKWEECNNDRSVTDTWIVPNDSGPTRVTGRGLGTAIITDDWMGVEFHYRVEKTAGTSRDGLMEAWIYTKDGDVLRSAHVEGVNFIKEANQGHKFNRFFFGGNNSGAYLWGPTMQAPYYVDDFIVHGSRIGPTYFSIAVSSLAPAAPKNLRITGQSNKK